MSGAGRVKSIRSAGRISAPTGHGYEPAGPAAPRSRRSYPMGYAPRALAPWAPRHPPYRDVSARAPRGPYSSAHASSPTSRTSVRSGCSHARTPRHPPSLRTTQYGVVRIRARAARLPGEHRCREGLHAPFSASVTVSPRHARPPARRRRRLASPREIDARIASVRPAVSGLARSSCTCRGPAPATHPCDIRSSSIRIRARASGRRTIPIHIEYATLSRMHEVARRRCRPTCRDAGGRHAYHACRPPYDTQCKKTPRASHAKHRVRHRRRARGCQRTLVQARPAQPPARALAGIRAYDVQPSIAPARERYRRHRLRRDGIGSPFANDVREQNHAHGRRSWKHASHTSRSEAERTRCVGKGCAAYAHP